MGTGNSKEPSHHNTQNHYIDFAPGTSSQAKSKKSRNASSSDEKDDIFVPTMFRWPYSGRRVFIVGTFNHWKEKIPMTYNSDENSFVVILNVSVGRHLYRFIVDNEYKTDPNASTCKDDQGYLHNVIEIVEPIMNKKHANNSSVSRKYSTGVGSSSSGGRGANGGGGGAGEGSPIDEDESYDPYEEGYEDDEGDDEEDNEDVDDDEDFEDDGEEEYSANVISNVAVSNIRKINSHDQPQQQQQAAYSVLNHPDASTVSSGKSHHVHPVVPPLATQQQPYKVTTTAPPTTTTTSGATAVDASHHHHHHPATTRATTSSAHGQHGHGRTHSRTVSEDVNDPQQMYTQVDHFFEEDKKNPPLLPPHLRYTVLNSTRKSVHDPALLPVPLHVTVNHAYFSDRESMNVIGVTQRYRDKFSTAVLYKPKKLKS